jgi:hypothetical protein
MVGGVAWLGGGWLGGFAEGVAGQGVAVREEGPVARSFEAARGQQEGLSSSNLKGGVMRGVMLSAEEGGWNGGSSKPATAAPKGAFQNCIALRLERLEQQVQLKVQFGTKLNKQSNVMEEGIKMGATRILGQSVVGVLANKQGTPIPVQKPPSGGGKP